MKIGFIGQGFIGKNYADDFEERGYEVIRYATDPTYADNKETLKECDIVFIAVPTPSTPEGFDDSIVREVVGLVGKGKIAVIKSTMLPGSTQKIQEAYPDTFVFHSPEFLREVTAAEDARHPKRNIVGISRDTKEDKEAAQKVLDVMPPAAYSKVCAVREAELIKYVTNCFLYTKVVFMNMLYDLSSELGTEWETIKQATIADPRIGDSHMQPVHESGHGGGAKRGAGGHCFIKDFAAFRELYEEVVGDSEGIAALKGFEKKNNALLKKSEKDLDLLRGVYGEGV